MLSEQRRNQSKNHGNLCKIDTSKTQIDDHTLSWLGIGTSVNENQAIQHGQNKNKNTTRSVQVPKYNTVRTSIII